MIVVTVFLTILNQMEFHLVTNRKENYHHDHIPFNAKGNGYVVVSVWSEVSDGRYSLGAVIGETILRKSLA